MPTIPLSRTYQPTDVTTPLLAWRSASVFQCTPRKHTFTIVLIVLNTFCHFTNGTDFLASVNMQSVTQKYGRVYAPPPPAQLRISGLMNFNNLSLCPLALSTQPCFSFIKIYFHYLLEAGRMLFYSTYRIICGTKRLVKRRKYVRIFNSIYSLWVQREEKVAALLTLLQVTCRGLCSTRHSHQRPKTLKSQSD
jgi:hypothetical protein